MKQYIAIYAILVGLLTGCATDLTPAADEAPVAEEIVATEQVIESEEVIETEQVVETEQAPVAESVEEPKEERTTTMIVMKTSKGDIKIELNEELAPKTVENFMKYVNAGHYSGTIFHRVINGFMIQGGGFDVNMNQKAAPHTVENEASNGLKNEAGTIAMARTAAPHSAGAQFFINVNDNVSLNAPAHDGWGYCVFGKVVEGMDVVNEIKGVPTATVQRYANVPVKPIIINEVIVVE